MCERRLLQKNENGRQGIMSSSASGLRRIAPVALLSLLFLCAANPAGADTNAEKSTGAVQCPSEISLDNGTLEGKSLSLADAVDIAVAQSRTLKASVNKLEASWEKVSETKKQFGLNMKVEANYQRVHDPTSFAMPYTYYDVAPIYIPGVLPQPWDLPDNLKDESMYTITDPAPKFGFLSAEINQNWQHGAELKISKPLLTFGKKRKAVAAARSDSEVKELDVELERRKLMLNVRKSFYQVLLAERAVEAQEESVERARAHVEAANSRFNAGVVPKLNVIRARSDLEQAKEKLIMTNKGHALSIMSFNNLLGFPVSRKTELNDESAYRRMNLKPLDFYYALAFVSRPEIKQIELAQNATELAAELEEKKAVFSLAGTWTFHNRGSTFASQDAWRAIIAGEIPVFDNGLASAKKAQVLKRRENLNLSETDLREGIQLQVKSAYLDVIEANQRIESSEVILEIADEAYRMADIGFKEGVTAQIDLIDAEHTLTQARLNSAKAYFDYETAKAQLAYSCGVDSLEDYVNE